VQNPVPAAQDPVLVGSGDSLVHLPKSFGMRRPPRGRVSRVAREVETPYSGMLPGWVAGHCACDAFHIDLGRLTCSADARFSRGKTIGIGASSGPRR
jgi:selenide, water dikinase